MESWETDILNFVYKVFLLIGSDDTLFASKRGPVETRFSAQGTPRAIDTYLPRRDWQYSVTSLCFEALSWSMPLQL
jgi:hypothetical protein